MMDRSCWDSQSTRQLAAVTSRSQGSILPLSLSLSLSAAKLMATQPDNHILSIRMKRGSQWLALSPVDLVDVIAAFLASDNKMR